MDNKEKEIIFVTRMLSTGGAERVISELANEWVKQNVSVSIIQLETRNNSDDYGLSNDVGIINFEINSKNRFVKRIKEVAQLVKILGKSPKATAISFVFSSNYVLGICGLFVRNKIVLSERNDPHAMSFIKGFIQKLAFIIADICVFQTSDARKFYPKSVQKKGVIIPNPINPNLPEKFEGRRNTSIVTAGRLDPQKNLMLLVNAFARVNKEYPEYKLVIYGRAHMPGNTEELLKQRVSDLSMGHSVIFAGFSTNLHEQIKEAAMYVCSSDYEGISNSVLEALAIGLPTISTDCPIGGAREMITNGENGILTPVGDEDALFNAMMYLIENPEKSIEISNEAYKIRYKYPIETIANEWLRAIQ